MANEELIALSEVKKKLTAIRQYFTGYPSTEQDKLARSVVKLCMEEVGKIKPVDAVEVVHGRWVIQRYYGGMRKGMVARVVCSECFTPNEETNYCPNCGAKMDGERRTDNA